jgi:metallo-beta-lactamase class B
MKHLLAALALAPFLTNAAHAQDDLQPIKCSSCADWNKEQAPFNIVNNTWYVGPAGLSSVLITSPQGHILIDGALPQSGPLIEKNIKALGFRIEDVKLIVNSHAHFDHAGGIAYLQRKSGAAVAASRAGAKVLETGDNPKEDAQYDGLKDFHMARVAKVRAVKDGETLSVGALHITAHLTPGHAPGGATWSWRSCGKEGCHDVVFVDSLSAVSDDGYRFSDASRHPGLPDAFRATIAKVGKLECDVAISAHPGGTGVLEKAAARSAGSDPEHNPFIVPGICRTYAESAMQSFEERLKKERAPMSHNG